MALQKIKKRDGRIVDFEIGKIENAIRKAFLSVEDKDEVAPKVLAGEVLRDAQEKFIDTIPCVEDIQDLVERVLIKKGYAEVAKAYIIYRQQHTNIRDLTYMFDYIDIVDSYLNQSDWMIKENANMNYSLQGLNFFLSSKLISRYWRDKIYHKEVSAAHTLGDVHIHNLSIFGAYCVGWDLKDFLIKGFTGVAGKVQSKPVKHFKPALGQTVNFVYTLQGESAGAQTFSNLNTILSPFIRYDNLDYKKVKQNIQDFLFNMNIPTRVGFQTPFTNVSMDFSIPDYLKNEKVIIGGIPQNEVYGDFGKELDMFNRAFSEVMTSGDAKGRPFTFPIPNYNITDEFDWDDEKHDSFWELTSKYGSPYFSNFLNPRGKPEQMGCKPFLNKTELKKKSSGFFSADPLTGSIGMVTVNLPRIGYLSRNEDIYFEKLGHMMDIAKDSLEIKRKIIENFTDKRLYPYSSYYLNANKEFLGKYWANHFSTIGLIGMNESIINLMGENSGTKEGNKFSVKALDFMRKRLVEFQEETGNMYNLEATPAESTAYRLALLDKEKYPDIIVANEENYTKGSEPFYTNSSHLPVNHTDNLFEALELQEDLQSKYTGGTAFHVFLSKSPGKENAKKLVRYMLNNYKTPCTTITPTFGICPEHGYSEGNSDNCSLCSKPKEVYSRIVGYLRPVSQWNGGKKEEFLLRKKFDGVFDKI